MTGHDHEYAALLASWRAGQATPTELYVALRDPMRRAARRSIGDGLAERPNEADVDWAVQRAFETLLAKGPDAVKTSLRGFAATIAHYRGKDRAPNPFHLARADSYGVGLMRPQHVASIGP